MTLPVTRKSEAFTLIELLVVIAIIAILAAILFPVFASARDKARQASCLSNTKQIGTGLMLYVQDYDEVLPQGAIGGLASPPPIPNRWNKLIYPYIKNVNVYSCPSVRVESSFAAQPFVPVIDSTGYPNSCGGYGANYNIMVNSPITSNPPPSSKSLSEIKDAAGTFVICDASQLKWADLQANPALLSDPEKWANLEYIATDWAVVPPTSFTGSGSTAGSTWYANAPANDNFTKRPVPRHAGGLNVIYCDGHAKWSKITDFLGIPKYQFGWPYGDPKNTWDDQ